MESIVVFQVSIFMEVVQGTTNNKLTFDIKTLVSLFCLYTWKTLVYLFLANHLHDAVPMPNQSSIWWHNNHYPDQMIQRQTCYVIICNKLFFIIIL